MDDEYEYLRTGPGEGWTMSKELYARCPRCGYYMSLDPSTDDVCPCGNLCKDSGAGRFGADSGDASIAIYQRTPSAAAPR